MKKTLFLFVLVALVMISSGCSVLDGFNEPVDPSNTAQVLFTVPAGASTNRIAEDLEVAKLINSALSFKMLSKELGSDGKMQAGDYKLSQAMSSQEIIDKMVDGDVYIETITFTIPEGYEAVQIIDILVETGLGNKEEIEDLLVNEPFDYKFLEGVDRSYKLEGFLFPDTYEIRKGASAKEAIVLMLNKFDLVFKPEYYDLAAARGLTISEMVTMASIVEREAVRDDERARIAGVFWNRIDKNWKLESCATVQYILGERKPVLTYEDITIQSPFNTYIETGLPPGPISSPGEKSIIATVYPEDTEYMFFVTTDKGDGSHTFSKTLKEHNAAIKAKKKK